MKGLNLKDVDVTGIAMNVGGGIAGSALIDVLDTKVAFFSANPKYSPAAVAALGILGAMFAPKNFKPVFTGMITTSGVEFGRQMGIIKGIEDTLGELVPTSLMRSDRVYN